MVDFGVVVSSHCVGVVVLQRYALPEYAAAPPVSDSPPASWLRVGRTQRFTSAMRHSAQFGGTSG